MGLYDELLALAEQIRTEKNKRANDAERIGTMFKKIISYLPLIGGVKEVTQINTSLAKGVYIYTHTSSGTTYNDILFVTKSSNDAGMVDTHFLLFNKSQYSLQYRRNDEAFSDVFKYNGRTYFINDISDKDLQTFFRNIGYINMSDKYEANFIHTLDGIVYAGADVIEDETTEEQKVSRFQIRLSGFGMYYRRLPYKDNPDTNFGSTPFIPLGHVNLGEIENEEYLDNVIELGIYSYIVTNGFYRRHKILFVTHSVSTIGSLNQIVQTKMESDISDSGEVILKRYTRTGQNNTIGQPDKYNWTEWVEDTGGITQEQKAIIDNLPISVMHDMEIEPEENQVNLRYTSKILSSGDDDVNQISIPAATTEEAGVMSAADKTKLDNLQAIAEIGFSNLNSLNTPESCGRYVVKHELSGYIVGVLDVVMPFNNYTILQRFTSSTDLTELNNGNLAMGYYDIYTYSRFYNNRTTTQNGVTAKTWSVWK